MTEISRLETLVSDLQLQAELDRQRLDHQAEELTKLRAIVAATKPVIERMWVEVSAWVVPLWEQLKPLVEDESISVDQSTIESVGKEG